MNIKSLRILLPLLLVALMCNLSFGTTLVVNKTAGPYTTITAALQAADALPPYDPCEGNFDQVTIEVQDNATYTGEIIPMIFPADQNALVLKAGPGVKPTIPVSGSAANTKYIVMSAKDQKIKGLRITFSGTAPTVVDNNSAMIFAVGGATTVEDCNIIGPSTSHDPLAGWIMGITAVANIKNTSVEGCRLGIVADINEIASDFVYDINNCRVFGNHDRGMVLSNCTAVVSNCYVYDNGNTNATYGLDGSGNILIDGNDPAGLTNVLIKDSKIKDSFKGRNINMETYGTATLQNCLLIMNTSGNINDNILQYDGTLNLNNCLIDTRGGLAGINCNRSGQWGGGVANVDHCTIIDNPLTTQWALFTLASQDAQINITNSIITGPLVNYTKETAYGLYQGGGIITTNFNDIYCSARYAGEGPDAGPNDVRLNPQFIQTNNDANKVTYFVLQPYSPVAEAGKNVVFGDTYMGWKAPKSGYERWPADLIRAGADFGVNFKDFASFASHAGEDNRYVVDPNILLENMEGYSVTGSSGTVGTLLGPRLGDSNDCWRVVPNWLNYNTGLTRADPPGSVLTLQTDSNSPFDPTGTKYMKWEYTLLPVPPQGDPCYSTYSEIMYVLPHGIDLSKHNTLRVMMRRHQDNTSGSLTFMYAKFLDVTKANKTTISKEDIVRTIVGGSTDVNAGEWYPWNINIQVSDANTGWETAYVQNNTITNWRRISAIIFGIQTQPNGPYDADGHGIIDVDTIQLSVPGCPSNPVGDFNLDCVVNIRDADEFAYYWLMGR